MNKSISDKIAEFRKVRSLTQEKLGEMLGVSSQAVSKWEKGDSLPDIMLLPQLCEIFGISIDTLLEMPVAVKNTHIMKDICSYASDNGKSTTLIDIISRMFNDYGNPSETNWIDFGPNYLRVYDTHGMGFVVNGNEYLNSCLNNNTDDIMYILRILCDETLLSVIKLISIDKAITKDEICEATGLDEVKIDQILTGFFKRGIIVCEKDNSGKRGYLQSNAMAGIYLILAGCQVLSENGAINCFNRFTRIHHAKRT